MSVVAAGQMQQATEVGIVRLIVVVVTNRLHKQSETAVRHPSNEWSARCKSTGFSNI